MEKNTKEPVRIRQKELANGNKSLYLDIYVDKKRHYEFLKLYLVTENTRADKEKNRQTMQLANSIKAVRMVEIQNKEYGFRTNLAEETFFYDYYVSMVDKRIGSKGNWGNWQSCLKHLLNYDKKLKARTFSDITPKWVQGFRDYLDNDACAWECDVRNRVKNRSLSQNSKTSYFRKLKACLNKALEDGIISFNPAKGIDGIKQEEGTRMYLTINELKQLTHTDCDYPIVKRAFLFSCLTGLRRSDVEKLTWKEIQQQGDFTRIIFKQKKTKEQEYLDISPLAVEMLGERGKADEHPFAGLHTTSVTNNVIKDWVARAGINKEITFHCGRHTFAVMMLDLGTDIYTVSKLLGHRSLSTTQIYAKVLDKNKQKAVSKIPDIFSDNDNNSE